MESMKKFFVAGFSSALLLLIVLTQSCSTDVDLAAPYKSSPVIFAVLDPRVDTQFVRINRTFLSPTNPLNYSSIRDSIEYADGEVDAWIIKYDGNNAVDSFELRPIDLPSRDPGVFYDTDVRFFFTDAQLLSDQELNNVSSFSFEMRATLRELTYRARTDVPSVVGSTLSFPPVQPPDISVSWVTQGVPTAIRFEYSTHPTGGRYQGELVLVYDAEMTDGSLRTDQELVYPAGSFNAALGSQLANRNFNFNSSLWFNFVGPRLRQIEGLQRARFKFIDYRLSVSNRDLNAYMSVVNPQSTTIPLFTTFSNFDNGAIGILGVKQTLRRSVFLNQPTMVYFNTSEATGDIPFCTEWNAAGFLCD